MMKTFVYNFFTVLLLTACCIDQTVRYFLVSSPIGNTKSILKRYLEANREVIKLQYADTAIIYNDVPERKGVSIDAAISGYKNYEKRFSTMSNLTDEDIFEKAHTADCETWINYRGVWKDTLKANGEVFNIPSHLTQRIVNQKIVHEHGHLKSSAFTLALFKQDDQFQQL